MIAFNNLLQEVNIHPHMRDGITIACVASPDKGITLTKYLLEQLVDRKTIIFLSGGKTPRALYEQLSFDEAFLPGAVGMVDERCGEKLHKNSNELMLQESVLIRGLALRNIPFYPILHTTTAQASMTRQQTAEAYDQTVRELLQRYPRSIGLLGIGSDGHTAGLLPQGEWWGTAKGRETTLVTSYESTDQFKERISMTFLGLSMLDTCILLVFGYDKSIALEAMFSEGSEEEVPARFYTRAASAKKTLIITDQEIV